MLKNILFLLFLLHFINGNSQVLEVCESCGIKTIKAAVNKAENGDTIIVKNGTYKEHDITILNKSITILGEGLPVIDAEMKGTAISIRAENFSIEGLKIINVGRSHTNDFAGILVSNSKNFEIKNNRLDQIFFGILVERSSDGIISGNKITSNATNQATSGNGVHIWKAERITVKNNEIIGLRDGIYFEFVTESTVSKNISRENLRYGLHFMFSNNDEYLDNTFENNGAGVAVMFSKHIKMYRNLFKKNWGTASYGLLLKEITDAELKNNIFEDNSIGIHADGTSRMEYTENDFLNNGYAIKVLGACYNNTFSKNNFLYNSFDLAYSGHINENKFDGNYWSNYSGYDLDKDGIGDVPHRPVKLFSYLVNKTPGAIILLRSMFIDIIDFSEKVSPIFTPAELVDEHPQMKRIIW